MLKALFHFSSRWSLLPELAQRRAFTVLEKFLQYSSSEPVVYGVFVKCVLIQLLSSTGHSMSNTVLINEKEVLSLLRASSSRPPILAAIEVLLLVKCLILYEDNKHALLEQDIAGFLTPFVDDESNLQQQAAELICSLMSASANINSVSMHQESSLLSIQLQG